MACEMCPKSRNVRASLRAARYDERGGPRSGSYSDEIVAGLLPADGAGDVVVVAAAMAIDALLPLTRA